MTKHSNKRHGAKKPATGQIQHPSLLRAVQSERWKEAEVEARNILKLRPSDPFALKALGCSLTKLGQETEAIQFLQKALAITSNDSEILNNLGNVYLFNGEYELSIEHYKKALAIKPKDFVIWKNLGRCYLRLQRPRDAVEALARAIEFHPENFHEAVNLLATALEMGGQSEQSLEVLKELWEHGWPCNSVLGEVLFTSLKLTEWERFDELLSEFRKVGKFEDEHASSPLQSLSFPGSTWEEHYSIACGYALGSLAASENVDAGINPNPSRDRKLRIGYFSGDYRAHPVGYLIPQILELHDREKFEVIGYSVGTDENSDIRQRIKNAFDRFVDLGLLASRQAIEVIRRDQLDVLINLQGWTNDYASELFSKRSAPVQCSWLGYAGTLGHPVLADYLIGDPIVTPIAQTACFTETLALLDCCYLPMDTTASVPGDITRKEAELPENAFVFCSFNNRYKINPPLFDLWCDILRQCPNSLLWISNGKQTSNNNLLKEFERRGLDRSRLVFAPRVPGIKEHRQRIAAADLALDTMPYNSHSSGLDMLWAGVPMVSMLGETFASRVGASLLHYAGIPELITSSRQGYVDLAVSLYHDRPKLTQLRQQLSAGRQNAVLWNTEKLTRSLERIYRTAFENHCSGKKTPIDLNNMPPAEN